MKVLFVPSDNNPVSGAFRSMAALNKILNEEYGIQTLVVLPTEVGEGAKLLDDMNIRHTCIRSYNWIVKSDRELTEKEHEQKAEEKEKNKAAVKRFVELIKKEKIDLIHINTTYTYVAAIAGRITNTPIVWHLREFLEEDQKRRIYDREFGYKLIGKADKIITISKALYKKYESILPVDKMQVIYNGIDTDTFYKPEKQIFINDDRYIFVCAGSVNYNKGQDSLVHACGKLMKKRGISNFELWLVGFYDERYEGIINRVAQKYGIEEKVKLLGPQKDVASYFEKADIAFMCSKFEAFGRVTVEGMLSGALMIGANTGGTTELIEDGKTGLLYEQGNSDDLCDKIYFALQHKEAMRKIAAAGRRDMYENMSARRNAAEIVEAYKEVIKNYKRYEVYAVIVTYNRLNMLKDCLAAVLKQTYASLKVVVVDNASTDGTQEYIKALKNERILYINTGKNVGGAGGFHRGIKEAYLKGAKWVWIMDDDVIPKPDALQKLMEALKVVKPHKTSFLASCVYGLNGEAMNTPGVDLRSKNGYPFWYEYLDRGLVKLNAATFVSILVNAAAIEKCGLPCSNFFIWGDDTEYTKRLYRNFGLAYLVGASKVVHARANASDLSIFTETNPNRISIYSYKVRNTLIYTREYAGEESFNQKLVLFEKDCKKLKVSDDPYKEQKIAAIRQGIQNYYRYDFTSFRNRFDLFYEDRKCGQSKTGKNKQDKSLRSQRNKTNIFRRFIQKIRNAYRYWKKNGFKATVRRAIYGRPNTDK